MRNKLSLIVALGLVAAPMAAQAVPITYAYVGPSFNTPLPAGIPPGVTGISATFTVDLAPNSIGTTATSWSISDGLTTISESSADFAPLNVRFQDIGGNLVGAQMLIRWEPLDTVAHPIPLGANYLQSFAFGTFELPDTTYYCTEVQGRCTNFAFASAFGTGSLQVVPTSVPEPGTLALLGLGLAGLSLARRKRAA